MSPTMGFFSPMPARMKTVITNALEIGFESEIPREIPLTIRKTKTSATATRTKNTGSLSSRTATAMTARAQKMTQIQSIRLSVRFQSSAGGAVFPFDSLNVRAAETASFDMSTIAAPRIIPSATMNPIFRNGSCGPIHPLARSHGVRRRPIAPRKAAGIPIRIPTIIPAPSVDAEKPVAATGAVRLAASPGHEPRERAASKLRDGGLEDADVRQRPQDVRHGEAGRERKAHPIDQNRRVEHPDTHAEHPDAEEVEHELPGRRFGESEPGHRLDQHGHPGEARDGSGHGLHVVRAVLSFRAVAVGDHAAQDAGQHLPAHEEPEREVHVGGRDSSQRSEDEDGDGAEEDVVGGAVDRGQNAPESGHGAHYSVGSGGRKRVIGDCGTASRRSRERDRGRESGR